MGPGSFGKARWRDRVTFDGWVRGFGTRGKGLETSPKGKSRKETAQDGRRRTILLRKVVGSLGRPFGGSGLSKYSFRT